MKYITAYLAAITVTIFLYLFVKAESDMLRFFTRLGQLIVFFAELAIAITVVAFVVGLALIAYTFVVKIKNTDQSRRMVDGAWPERFYHIQPWHVRVFNALTGKPIYRVRVDHNLDISPVSLIGGDVGYRPVEPPYGWENAVRHAAVVQRVNAVRAATPGDAALSTAEFRPVVPKAKDAWQSATMGQDKWPTGNDYQPPRPVTIEQPAAAPTVHVLPPLTAQDALNEVRKNQQLVFGRNNETELAVWDRSQTPHLRIHGASQSGKTSAALMLTAGATACRERVIVLDPRRFKNWGTLTGYAELVDVRNPVALAEALKVLIAEHGRRDALLGKYNASDIDAIPYEERPERIVVAIDELTAQRSRAVMDGLAQEIDAYLSILAAESAACGIHLLTIDQKPEGYPGPVKVNLTQVVFPVTDQDMARACGYSQAHRLERYTFHFMGKTFTSIDAQRELAGQLKRYAPVNQRPPLIDLQPAKATSHTVQPAQTVSYESSYSQDTYSDDEPAARSNVTGLNLGKAETKWFDFVLEYMTTEAGSGLWLAEPRGVRDLARAMSAKEFGSELYENRFTGVASTVSRIIREQAKFRKAESVTP